MSAILWLKQVFDGKKKIAASERELKEINQQLIFAASEPLSLGVEFELALLDKNLKPAHEGLAIIAEANRPAIKKESYEHMVEVTTGVCRDTHDAESQLGESIAVLKDLAEKKGVLVTGTGRPPTIKLADCHRLEDARYKYLHEGRKILQERLGILGMHVHIGMTSAEKCIRYHNFYMHFLPHFIALAAASPFEDGVETGLASIRSTVTEALPVAGMPYDFNTWQEYTHLCQAMFRAGSIHNLKDLWWDLRPAPRYGTLEIRVCDQPSNLDEAMAIVAFMHALGLWFEENQSWLEEMSRPGIWRARENKWRAMRYGLDARLVRDNLGETTPIVDDIKAWLDRTQDQYARLKYQRYKDTLLNILARGNGAKRQLMIWTATGSLEEVARFSCREWQGGKPLWQAAAETAALKPQEAPAETRDAAA